MGKALFPSAHKKTPLKVLVKGYSKGTAKMRGIRGDVGTQGDVGGTSLKKGTLRTNSYPSRFPCFPPYSFHKNIYSIVYHNP
jgi:hypothetical protein